jgi:hypothetical protein
VYAHLKHDVSGAFTIAGLFCVMFSCLCLIYMSRVHDWSISCDLYSYWCFESH